MGCFYFCFVLTGIFDLCYNIFNNIKGYYYSYLSCKNMLNEL